jgi:hypothetical protein
MAAAELTAMRGMALPTPVLSKVSSLVVLNNKTIGALLRRGGRSSSVGKRTSEGRKRRPPVPGTSRELGARGRARRQVLPRERAR